MGNYSKNNRPSKHPEIKGLTITSIHILYYHLINNLLDTLVSVKLFVMKTELHAERLVIKKGCYIRWRNKIFI